MQPLRRLVRLVLSSAALAIAVHLTGIQPAAGQVTLDVSEIEISVTDQRSGGTTDQWNFEISVEGVNITSATFQPPGGATEDLIQDGTFWEYSENFVSLVSLQGKFGNGSYTVTVNSQPLSLTYDLSQDAPTPALGAPLVTFPANGAAIPNRAPIFTATNGCTNCTLQEAFIETSVGEAIDIESTTVSPSLFPNSFEFSDLPANTGTLGPIAQLPEMTSMRFSVFLGNEDTTATSISDLDNTFDYLRLYGVDDGITFTVADPGMLNSNVDDMTLEYADRLVAGVSTGWWFAASLNGSSLGTATLIPPNQAPVALSLVDDELDFADGPEASEAAVRLTYPPTDGVSKYVLVLDGGEKFYAADFAPGSPDGGTVITAPLDGSTVGSQPTITITNACTNCTSQIVEVEDDATDGDEVSFAKMEAPPSSESFSFAQLGGNQGTLGSITELPDGDYGLYVDTTVETFSNESTEGDDFIYFAGTFREDQAVFTVPEPGSGLQAAMAVLVLGSLGRRRRPIR